MPQKPAFACDQPHGKATETDLPKTFILIFSRSHRSVDELGFLSLALIEFVQVRSAQDDRGDDGWTPSADGCHIHMS